MEKVINFLERKPAFQQKQSVPQDLIETCLLFGDIVAVFKNVSEAPMKKAA